ncbi:MAG: hypothetical protein HOP15_14350, partial [Planctomycetes bacterium]|nr:hypothetical protein [Planctomycetota bacterium]
EGELVWGVVVGLYDAGKIEIYGFGKGPGGKPPNGKTLFDLGTTCKELGLAGDATRLLEKAKALGVSAPAADEAEHSGGTPGGG